MAWQRLSTALGNETAGPVERELREMDYAVVRTYGDTVVPSDEPVCNWCKGAHYVAVREFTGGMFTGNRVKPCGKCSAQRHEARWDRIGVSPILRFEDWRDVPAMQQARKACDELLEGKRHCVYLSAQTGRGKTHLAKATVVAWVERGKGSAVFRTVPDILDELRQSFDADAPWSLTERMRAYEKADLLVLDDLGAEKATDWVAERLFSLIDKRLGAGRNRPTFVTSNVAPDSDRIPMRIASRLAPGLIQINGGVDFRQKQFSDPAPWAK